MTVLTVAAAALPPVGVAAAAGAAATAGAASVVDVASVAGGPDVASVAGGPGAVGVAGPLRLASIQARYLSWYREAARTCRGLSWRVLAGIGTMESDNGRSRARGVHSGKNRKGAEGPMQFEPATFAEYAVKADPAHRLTPYDPADAIFTAARMLCADGAASGSPKGLRRAIYAYNHACWYVRDVLAVASGHRVVARVFRHARKHHHDRRRHRRHQHQQRRRRHRRRGRRAPSC